MIHKKRVSLFNKEDCLKIARKFSTKSDFHNKERNVYDLCRCRGWMEEVTAHMKNCYNKTSITYEEAKNYALKYNTRKDFKLSNDSKYYYWGIRYKCIDKLCEHMTPIGNNAKRCIYVYEFPYNVCYVGLTRNIIERDIEHRTSLNSTVREYSIKNKIDIPNPKQLTDYIDKNEASEKEGYFYNLYKKNGWKVLNKSKTGGLGGKKYDFVIDIEYCKEKAKDCLTRSEFEKKYKYLYCKVKKNKWDDIVFSHMSKELSKKVKGEKISKSRKGKHVKIKNYDEFIKNHSKNPVLQYDLNGDFIKEYLSSYDASRQLFGTDKKSSSIVSCCRGKIKTAYGFIWKYKNKESLIPKKYNIKKEQDRYTHVLQFDLNGNFIREFKSCADAARGVGSIYSNYNISKCCKGKLKTCLGYVWKFK